MIKNSSKVDIMTQYVTNVHSHLSTGKTIFLNHTTAFILFKACVKTTKSNFIQALDMYLLSVCITHSNSLSYIIPGDNDNTEN